MKFKGDGTLVPRIALLFTAIVLGIVVGIGVGLNAPSGAVRPNGIHLYTVATLSVLFSLALVLAILSTAAQSWIVEIAVRSHKKESRPGLRSLR